MWRASTPEILKNSGSNASIASRWLLQPRCASLPASPASSERNSAARSGGSGPIRLTPSATQRQNASMSPAAPKRPDMPMIAIGASRETACAAGLENSAAVAVAAAAPGAGANARAASGLGVARSGVCGPATPTTTLPMLRRSSM